MRTKVGTTSVHTLIYIESWSETDLHNDKILNILAEKGGDPFQIFHESEKVSPKISLYINRQYTVGYISYIGYVPPLSSYWTKYHFKMRIKSKLIIDY